MTAALLSVLAVLDGLLVGMRSAAGRDGRVRKISYYARAQLVGLACTSVVVAVAWALAALFLARAEDPAALWRDLEAAGRPALLVWGTYGGVAILALAVYLWAALVVHSTELRTWATVLVLGPFTFVRPAVIVGGLLLAAATRPRFEVVLLVALVGAASLALEPLLRARRRRNVDALHAEVRAEMGAN